jgi:hypothetical protein
VLPLVDYFLSPAFQGHRPRALCRVPDIAQGTPACLGRGHRPGHIAALVPGPAGGQSPRPAPDPPLAGASPPPGRALASVARADRVLQNRGRGGRGKAMPFLIRPARPAFSQGRDHLFRQRAG